MPTGGLKDKAHADLIESFNRERSERIALMLSAVVVADFFTRRQANFDLLGKAELKDLYSAFETVDCLISRAGEGDYGISLDLSAAFCVSPEVYEANHTEAYFAAISFDADIYGPQPQSDMVQ